MCAQLLEKEIFYTVMGPWSVYLGTRYIGPMGVVRRVLHYYRILWYRDSEEHMDIPTSPYDQSRCEHRNNVCMEHIGRTDWMEHNPPFFAGKYSSRRSQ